MLHRPLIGIVASYAGYGVAKPETKPKQLFTFGGAGEEDGKFVGACFAIASGVDSNIWVADVRGVHVFNHEGKFLFRAAPKTLECGARGIACDRNGQVFISLFSGHVAVCDLLGRLLHCFAMKPGHDGTAPKPWGLCVDHQGLVFVVCTQNNHIQVFNRDGSFVRFIEDDRAKTLRGVAMSPDNFLWATDTSEGILVSPVVCFCWCCRR